MKRFLTLLLLSTGLAGLAPAQTAARAPAAKPTTAMSGKTGAKPKAPVIDINAASLSELKSIPGIGDAYAAKIIAGRPYKTKAQLKSRNILPDAVYEKTKDNMVAKQK